MMQSLFLFFSGRVGGFRFGVVRFTEAGTLVGSYNKSHFTSQRHKSAFNSGISACPTMFTLGSGKGIFDINFTHVTKKAILEGL